MYLMVHLDSPDLLLPSQHSESSQVQASVQVECDYVAILICTLHLTNSMHETQPVTRASQAYLRCNLVGLLCANI